MKFRCEQEVSLRIFKATNGNITDEYLFRELVRKIVSEIPIDELHKLIKLTKTDPRAKESIEVMHGFDELEKEKIRNLDQRGCISYEAEWSDTEGKLLEFSAWLLNNPNMGYRNVPDSVKQFLEQ